MKLRLILLAALAVVLMTSCADGEEQSPAAEATTAEIEEMQTAAPPTAEPPATEFTSPLPPGQSPLPTPTDATEAQTGGQSTKPGPIEIVPPGQEPAPEPAPLTGEVPQDLLEAVFDDLLERLGVSREAIVVEQAGVVVWRDGSLGCPQPGMMYTQAPVDGYWVVLRSGSQEFDYRASRSGYFALCERGLSLPGTTPESDASKPSE